jgi:hypothetical protein
METVKIHNTRNLALGGVAVAGSFFISLSLFRFFSAVPNVFLVYIRISINFSNRFF